MNPYDVYPKCMQVFELVAVGKTVSRACKEVGLTVRAFQKACEENEQLGELHREAMQLGNDAMAEALVEIDSHELYGTSDARMAGVVSKNIQWLLSKRDTKRFGDKVQIEHTITADKAIVDALARAKNRALEGLPAPAPLVTDAVYTLVDEAEEAALRELLS